MEDILLASMPKQPTDKRLRLSWMKRTVPLNHSPLFNKAKHSQEWHDNVEATAGVLHPSDPKFPYAFLRNHTNVYIQKKGKMSQLDTDLRLSILVETHGAKGTAVAAAAHAIAAKSLRALLHAEFNVAPGSYWGLETWLQCLIAANDGNPASVTDLEATWARMLLPYAAIGALAAGSYLKGFCRALRKSATLNLNLLPEYMTLMRRAITDFSAQLEGFVSRCQWIAAHKAVFWMAEIETTSAGGNIPGDLLLEHILDSQFSAWKLWVAWRPDMDRLARLACMNSTEMATIVDIVALEGPDLVSNSSCTLREGLIRQYERGRRCRWLRFRGLVIEVPDRTDSSLAHILDRVLKAFDIVLAAGTGGDSLFALFRWLTVNQPITREGLNLFVAVYEIPYTSENDLYNTVREIYSQRMSLGGQNIASLRKLIHIFDAPQAKTLRKLMLHPWLIHGVQKCILDCQVVVQTHIDDSQPWIALALELHALCTSARSSTHISPLMEPQDKTQSPIWPTREQMLSIVDIHQAVQTHGVKARSLVKDRKDSSGQASIRFPLADRSQQPRHSLEGIIEDYCKHHILGSSLISMESQYTMNAILHTWGATGGHQVDTDRRLLALLILKHTNEDHALRVRCLTEIAAGQAPLEAPGSVKALVSIMRGMDTDPGCAIGQMTQLLAKRKAWTQCWKDLLYMWLNQDCKHALFHQADYLTYSLKALKAAEWLSLAGSLEALFIDRLDTADSLRPAILQTEVLGWKTQVSRFTSTLTRLETVLDNLEAVRCLLVCGEGFWRKNLLRILECLERAEGHAVEHLMQRIVGKLSVETKNAWEVKECVSGLLNATPESIEMYERIWDAAHGYITIPGFQSEDEASKCPASSKRSALEKRFNPTIAPSAQESSSKSIMKTRYNITPSVAEVLVAGWLQDDKIEERQKLTIESVASLLKLEVHKQSVPIEKLMEATLFWKTIEEEIVKEAGRLTQLTKALKAKDPRGTSLLLRELHISNQSLLDEALMGLPPGVIDMVERVSETEVEVNFSLSAYTELQRSAMGVSKTANVLHLRLSFNDAGIIQPACCLHFDDEPGLATLQHSPYSCVQDSTSPQNKVCSSLQTVFTFQLNRIIHTQLRIGNLGIESLYRIVKTRLESMGHACISCGVSHNAKNAQLRRSTPCDAVSCARLWYQLPLEVRVPEIKIDIFAVDILLTSVYAAAMSGRPELLPGCPFYGGEIVKGILNSLPNLTVLSHAANLSLVLKSYHVDAEKLISWACVHFRGFLATASGLCKIPNLPTGTHQFILANASPSLESTFITRVAKSGGKTTALFHGTTFDRLPAILAKGLKNCSGTPLQRIGAAHGKGIYLAEDPATSFTYSAASLSWRNSRLSNMKLMLGCEVAGNGRSVSSGIHVITDETSVMVRYLFLFTTDASAPLVAQITPTMVSSMSALRTGAV